MPLKENGSIAALKTLNHGEKSSVCLNVISEQDHTLNKGDSGKRKGPESDHCSDDEGAVESRKHEKTTEKHHDEEEDVGQKRKRRILSKPSLSKGNMPPMRMGQPVIHLRRSVCF